MRGVVFTGNETLELRNFPDPEAGPGEAVVRIRSSGLCGSDLHYYHAESPSDRISGHEPCGTIEELGPGHPAGLQIGDRVMVHHYVGCGVCDVCAMGYEQLCQKPGRISFGTTGHGSNADYMAVPARTLVPLPDELSFEEGAALSCGTATAWNGLVKMHVSGADTVAIYGQGPVGLSGTLCAKAMGARVIAIDVVPERLRLAQEAGADYVLNPLESDVVAATREVTGGGASAGLETSGNATARSQVLQGLRPFGRACYVGLGNPTTATLDFSRDLIYKVATIYGSWTFNRAELVEAARFMIEARVPLGSLITHRYALDAAAQAFEAFAAGATGKCVFVSS